jgi:PAS domain S-box-containing protein
VTKLFDNAILRDPQGAVEFITNILESATQISIIGKDIDGKIQLWNEGARRLYGYEPEEVVGCANSSMLHTPEDLRAGTPRKLMDAALRDGNWEGSVERVRKDGSRFIASVVLTPRRDASGTPIGFLLMSKDISDQIRLTEELKSTQFYTRSLIESNIDALVTTDPLGVITDVNQQMEALTGATREELIGSPVKRYFTDPQRAEEGIKLVLQEGTVTNYEMTVCGQDVRQTMVSYNASTFRDASGKLQGVIAAARDITEQKKLEQQLRDQQLYTRSLIESNIDALVTTDPLGIISDVNQQMEALTGATREELIGSPVKKYFTDSNRAEQGIRLVLEQGKVTNYELTARAKNGLETVVSYNATTFNDRDGKLQGVFAAARDITLTKQASQYARSLIESSLDPLVTISPIGKITDVNAATVKVTGVPREQLIGTDFSSYFTDPIQAQEGYKQAFDKGKVTDYALTLRSQTGQLTDVLYNATVYKDDQANILGVFAAARDVTKSKRAEQQFRGLLESAPDAMVIVDETGTIVLINTETERLFGYERTELLGKAVETLIPERYRGNHPSYRTGYYTDPMSRPMGLGADLYGRRKDGGEFPVEIALSPLVTEEGTLVSGVVRDITERKRFEQTLQEKNIELEQASMAKDRFLASMSHELRTPLNAIIGFTGTLLMRLPGPLTGPQDMQLKTIQSSSQHLLSLINDLLDLAKIESGKVELNPEPVVCQRVLEEVSKTLRLQAESKGLTFELVTPADDVIIQTDRRALSQIVINLATNAIKFTDTGGVVIRLDQRQEMGELLTDLSVVDTGVGILPEDQVRLFQAFEQLASPGMRPKEGTGLGLHLSQILAHLLDGHIAFSSKIGEGSTFTITLRQPSEKDRSHHQKIKRKSWGGATTSPVKALA